MQMLIRNPVRSFVPRPSLLRMGLALLGATGATGAFAQTVTQSLILTFPSAAPLPIGGWTLAAIAALLAAAGGVLLGRRSRAGTWFWGAAALATGALLALPSIRSAEATISITPLNLITSPAQVSFTFPGAPPSTTVQVTNDTGATTHITSITLTPAPTC